MPKVLRKSRKKSTDTSQSSFSLFITYCSAIVLRKQKMLKFFIIIISLIIIDHIYDCHRIILNSNIFSMHLHSDFDRDSKNSSIPYDGVLGVASSNVIAYSNGNDSFYSNESHFINGIFMGMKWQCVEFARRWTFLRKNSIFESVDGAKDMWTQLKYIERVSDKKRFPLKHHPNGSPKMPFNESYLIYSKQKDMPYGHVAIIVQVLQDRIRVAEQNYEFYRWNNDYSREISLVFKNNRYFLQDNYEILGWIQIIDESRSLKSFDQSMKVDGMTLVSSGVKIQSNYFLFILIKFSIIFCQFYLE